VNPPSVHIVVEFERTEPIVYADYLTDAEQVRMEAWLERRPELAALIGRAVELAERERAA
jgi:hypothetical protein